MSRYPTSNEARILAKQLSQQLGIKHTHAQDAIAVAYYLEDWSALKDQFGKPCAGAYANDSTGMYSLQSPRAEVDQILKTQFPELKSHLGGRDVLIGSPLHKVLTGDLRGIPDVWLAALLEGERSKPMAKQSYAELVEEIQLMPLHLSDVMEQAMRRRGSLAKQDRDGDRYFVNPTLYFPQFNISFYAYHRFKGSHVEVFVRELDIVSAVGGDGEAVGPGQPTPSVTRRKWFQPLIIGFLNYYVQQLVLAGYRPRLVVSRICMVDVHKVAGAYVKDLNPAETAIQQILHFLMWRGAVIKPHVNSSGVESDLALHIDDVSSFNWFPEEGRV
ncbi:hypothetical protein [Ferrimonas marina]|uniref:Uncharacterized protein n=1 Tax=Ferrimonas marina TaxID=299255 RepID=A0A1M5U0G5_9GAMM|nr:hypothetical protein [Ferrimonas marina]SHH56366.1 hypothetical protein SAMN02745129_2350 [Ferrimonas marina]